MKDKHGAEIKKGDEVIFIGNDDEFLSGKIASFDMAASGRIFAYIRDDDGYIHSRYLSHVALKECHEGSTRH